MEFGWTLVGVGVLANVLGLAAALHGAAVHVADVAEYGSRGGRGQEVARIASGSGSSGCGGGTERAGQAAGTAAERIAAAILLHRKVLL